MKRVWYDQQVRFTFGKKKKKINPQIEKTRMLIWSSFQTIKISNNFHGVGIQTLKLLFISPKYSINIEPIKA